eukprot:10778430-Heterocapsa_arctica.AAC.1
MHGGAIFTAAGECLFEHFEVAVAGRAARGGFEHEFLAALWVSVVPAFERHAASLAVDARAAAAT